MTGRAIVVDVVVIVVDIILTCNVAIVVTVAKGHPGGAGVSLFLVGDDDHCGRHFVTTRSSAGAGIVQRGGRRPGGTRRRRGDADHARHVGLGPGGRVHQGYHLRRRVVGRPLSTIDVIFVVRRIDVDCFVPVPACVGGLGTRRRRRLGHNVDTGRWDEDILVSHRAGSGSLGVLARWILDASTGGTMGVMVVVVMVSAVMRVVWSWHDCFT